ncbi:type VI secretion system protein TssA [Pseudomonas fluorescens]|uniref:ImpA N-terminal domain-containing protein n=1 Tax=Pseudomonas fluorescens TaxID=294 RepID=A0A5E7BLC3_PSEFL|nr:type VI secretion system protein TssA [Pseudomonas fluorescens]VVN92415.1 hypothetical protein PS723_01978 [Pseudomonas fluorescens]
MSLVIDVPADVVKTLLKPVEPEQPVGHFDIEDETYQAIDQEMVKLGGLHEARIDWPYIDEAARQYLAGQCKHFRIMGHLLTVWLRTRQWVQWVDAVSLLAGMIDRYWDSAQPKPGPTGYLAKRKQVKTLMERLTEAVGALERQSFTPAQQSRAELALVSLQRNALTAKLDLGALEDLQAALTRHSERALQPTSSPAGPTTRSVAAETLSPAFFTSQGAAPQGNEREQRRALLTMAEWVNHQDPYDPAGYQLRRFGLWSHLHAAPLVVRERRTELMAVPNDIVDGYQEALAANAVDPALLRRIEKSVTASPYWIRGSFLAASIASRLEMGEVATAINQASQRFVRRIPALMELSFSDGTPFIDAQTEAWLTGVDTAASSPGAVPEYAGLREELITQLDQEGVEVVLLRLQGLQASYTAPRQRCYATIIAADLLAARGLAWLADDLCANVARVMRATLAEHWEPELFQKLAPQLIGQAGAMTAVKD